MDESLELARLAALHSYQLLDRPRPAVLDNLTGLAAALFDTPMSAVSLIDRDRQWFAGKTGLAGDQMSRAVSFCAHTLPDQSLVVVPDARRDDRFAEFPTVLGAPHVRFYAGAPIVDEDGYALGAVCVIDDRPRDTTDRLLDQLTALAGQAAGHFALIRSRLLLAGLGDELARAEQREEDLVATISHELRTPVASIQGYLELVADDPALADRFAEPIRRNGDRLVAMVDHLLAGTRPVPTLPAPVRAPVDLRAVAEAAIRGCTDLAASRDVPIVLDAPVAVPADADAVRLADATGQLVRNAVLFSPPGATVTVRVQRCDDGRPQLRVLDHGAGIPAGEAPYLFDRFSRGRHARDYAVPGVGLGLSIARQWVEAHGGELCYEPAPGGGSIFVLTLPRSTEERSDRTVTLRAG
ncbi:GAF domain-containing sensor histidine kinase [Cryptosporangium aurantiacum]|uniref:Sensor-like histidine kinase SenX3 n=1 Tax=Cryptosporangium aurantiacum TaxID=134849 RepID=A0A1M7RKM7_9ACTN|nr:GAF domain-containing sensor histidine kinase [Cryptosporangium aurantiacum]SHN46628.1 GAF domain-containing protein [Cryptosporangium aurantiacum]